MLKWRLLLGSTIILALIGLCWLDAQADLADGFQLQVKVPGKLRGAGQPPLLISVPSTLPGMVLMPVLLALTILATQEVLRLARAAGIRPAAPTIYVGNVLLVLGQWLPTLNLYLLKDKPGHQFDYMPHIELIYAGSYSALWALALGVVLIVIAEMRRYERPGGALANIAVGVFCLVYVGVMATFVVQMRVFWGVGALAVWIISVKMGDIGAYTVGRLIGRTRMSPTISPGKTMEGAAGAVLFACIGAWVSFHGIGPLPAIARFAVPSVAQPTGTVIGWLVFGVMMGVVGIVGDLAESLLKRDVGCKDSSAWMPGFGGVLDILDSLLITAPVAWLCWALGIVGSGAGL